MVGSVRVGGTCVLVLVGTVLRPGHGIGGAAHRLAAIFAGIIRQLRGQCLHVRGLHNHTRHKHNQLTPRANLRP